MKRIKLLLLCAVLCSQSLISGCWNYTDIEKYAIVSGFSIDKNEQGDKYLLTMEIVDYKMSGKDAGQMSIFVESEGTTIFDAIRNAINVVGKKLYWAHTDISIISQDIAKEGLIPVLDFIIRDAEMREQMFILISKEKTAKEVLNQQLIVNQASSVNIENMIKGQDKVGKSPMVETYELLNLLGEKGFSVSLPAVSLKKIIDKKTAILSGTAIFKSDQLIGYLNPDETKYFLFATNKFENGLLTLQEDQSKKTDDIALEVVKSKTKITPVMSNNKIEINLDIQTQLSIAELETEVDYVKEDNKDKLKKDTEKLLKESVEKIIKKVQEEYGADIFGFGLLIKGKFPSVWKDIEKDWEKHFKELKVQVTADVTLTGSGLMSGILKKGE